MSTQAKVYVVDFDNVVIRGSEEAKARAWKDIFGGLGPRALGLFEEAENTYGRGRGGDRFTIIRHVFQGLGQTGEELERSVNATSQEFDDAVQAYIARTGIEPSDREALEAMKRRGPLYLNSATPIGPLARSVEAIDGAGLFAGLMGRPKSKLENFQEVATKEGVSPEEIRYVGDSDSDWKVAREFGCEFLGLATPENGWGGKDMPFRVIRHLREALG